MTSKTKYISFDEVVDTYGKMIKVSGGGFAGIKNEGGIRSILDFVQNDDYYPTFVDKLNYLVFRFCTGHFFHDGNKRIALTVGSLFLLRNGYVLLCRTFMAQLEAIIYHVAASHISQDLLHEIIGCLIDNTDYPESVKLELMIAMDKEVDVNESEEEQ
mgnify:CR=1 FL=1